MPQNKEKIVQALVEAVNEVADLVEKANTLGQDYKTKFQTLNPDLADTSITGAQLSAINTWLNSLATLNGDPVVTVARAKRQPSHGTQALG